jgi:hypothetical protein
MSLRVLVALLLLIFFILVLVALAIAWKELKSPSGERRGPKR